MIYTACFDTDNFRSFALNSGIIDSPMDNVKLMKFAIKWVTSEILYRVNYLKCLPNII